MSIEKIKERIRMIEENNFNIIEEGDYRAHFNDEDPSALVNNDQTRNLWLKATQPKIIQQIGKAGSYANDAASAINRGMSGSHSASIGNREDIIEIPKRFQDVIYEIYNHLRDEKVLPTDLNDNGTAKYGYTVMHERNATANRILILQKLKLVTIYLNDDVENATRIDKIELNTRDMGTSATLIKDRIEGDFKIMAKGVKLNTSGTMITIKF